MKLSFETWCSDKNFSINVLQLYNESFICYKNGAYRASLLFSYLGLLTFIKELIIKSTKPILIEDSRWEKLIRKLQSDDTWEIAVYEELINSSSPIFNISDDLRQQIKYWKDRRNDCAHFKTNEIGAHHIESFWSFVRSNMFKITVEGGKESLLNKFEKHFDVTYTPPGTDIIPLVTQIDDSIIANDLDNFWDELFSIIDNWGFTPYIETNASFTANKIFGFCSLRTKEKLAAYIKRKAYDLAIITFYPDKIYYLNYTPEEVREIWRKRIINDSIIGIDIYGTLLRTSSIPTAQIKEANEFIIQNHTDFKSISEITHMSLASNGFGDTLFEIAIKGNRLMDWFNWVNPRADMLAYYIEKYPLRDETVEVICEMYTRDKYSFWLSERIIRIFTAMEQKRQEFIKIANKNKFTIPKEFL